MALRLKEIFPMIFDSCNLDSLSRKRLWRRKKPDKHMRLPFVRLCFLGLQVSKEQSSFLYAGNG